MPINSNNIIGNFTPYMEKDVTSFLSKAYGIQASRISVFNNAMDNTVLDIDNRYILKIYETKTLPHITLSLSNYKKFERFYCIALVKNKKDKEISFFKSKPAILYLKTPGTFHNNLLSIILHVSKFHQASYTSFRFLDLEKIVLDIKQQINFYLTDTVCNELQKCNRWIIYKELLAMLSKLPLDKSTMLLSYGFTHGDCSPDNCLTTTNGILFLDFDAIREAFQLVDLTDLFLKHTNTPNQNDEIRYLREYITATNFYHIDELPLLYNILKTFACYRGVLMALSTEYYCFEKQKFSQEIMNTLFLKKILLLLSNVQYRLKE